MVRAALEGRKSEHRRPVVGAPSHLAFAGSIMESSNSRDVGKMMFADRLPLSTEIVRIRCPYKKGDRIWVRERWASKCGDSDHPECVLYGATEADEWRLTQNGSPRLQSALKMPRSLCRISFEITGVRVDRITEITEEQAKAEGVVPMTSLAPDQRIISDEIRTQGSHPYTLAFAVDWDTRYFNRGYGWINVPHVWVLSLAPLEVYDVSGG